MTTEWTDEAMAYLLDGGLGEVIGLTSAAHEMDEPQVVINTDMAMALCLLAAKAIRTQTIRDLTNGIVQ